MDNKMKAYPVKILCLMSYAIFFSACTLTPSQNFEIDPEIGQVSFASPEQATEVFTDAVAKRDQPLIENILGEDFLLLLPLDNIEIDYIDTYLDLYRQSHSLIRVNDDQYLLAIGENQWTLPIPISKTGDKWYFDTVEGLERMRYRRIGRNELSAMKAMLAYCDAQMEYAEQDRNGDGLLEYAQKFISTPDKQDGLYWKNEKDQPASPLGPLFEERTPGESYHGYHYRILTAQGKNAAGGEYNYLIGNRLIAGFALIAWPAEYGETGIMSFIVNQEGVIYEKDLGPDGPKTVTQIEQYNPDQGWVKVSKTFDAS